ncbi:hypothetical protein [Orbus mooreae]|uniref:hypothetical protein n=1 Tax=Orbus mooreae TaxID=3074107 RepID=UPI00370DD4A4
MKKIILMSILGFILAGCSVHHQFNERLSYQVVKQLKSEIDINPRPSINIIWMPESFTQRIDIQGASGFVGGGTRTRIPIGLGLSSRIEEAISTYANLNNNGDSLVITVNEAKTKFTYGFTNMDSADVLLNLTFKFNGREWSKVFTSKQSDDGVRDASVTSVIEYAWDVIASDVAKNIADNI